MRINVSRCASRWSKTEGQQAKASSYFHFPFEHTTYPLSTKKNAFASQIIFKLCNKISIHNMRISPRIK